MNFNHCLKFIFIMWLLNFDWK